MKAFVAFSFTPEQLDEIAKSGAEILYYKDAHTEEDLKDVEAVVAFQPFAKYTPDAFPNLKLVQLMSAGINQVDGKDLRARGIALANARGIYSIPIAEWVTMHLLMHGKRVREVFALQADKNWEQWMYNPELTGKRIGIVGTGSIASEIVKRLTAFNVTLEGFNTTGNAVDGYEACYPIEQLRDRIPHLDALVLTAPDTPQTRHMIDEEVLQNAREDLFLINIGRGSLVDESALIPFLEKNKTAAAALDVFETEPLPQDSPLWTLPNVIVSPHVSASSNRVADRLAALARENLSRLQKGEPLKNEIDIDRGY